ncbi:MAG: GntR family transcriptional regulator [Clostridia bacterium]|nr:GntR family transcriptional regulator [Clostridia bacterium]
MFHYHINPDSETPIYRQLADQINAQIRSGALKAGTQLPTVREMAEKLHLSCGTIKHVYDRLQEMGDIEMTRRRGTFVKYVRKETDSRKHQAMHAIDSMIKKLMELDFSPAEIQIFLNLKMREWGLRWSGIRIAVVTDFPEAAPAIEKQLAQIGNVHINLCPLSQLREYPYMIDEQSDVILASVEDSQKLSYLLPESEKLIRIAFCAAPENISTLCACTGKIGVLCESQAFYDMLFSRLPPPLCKNVRRLKEDSSWEEADVLVMAEGYETTCSEEIRQQLSAFRGEKSVLEFAYRLDEGSMLYLAERINKLRDERQQWPGMLQL